jgi:non-heme chloroperoxidase
MTAHLRGGEAVRTMTAGARGQRYEFVLRGEIGDRFGLVFEGLHLERTPGHTALTGVVLDQAHLHGVIERIQELGIELVSLNPLDAGHERRTRKEWPMGTIAVRDGTQIHYKDWGRGRPVVLSHGWPLNADSWEAQMLFLAEHGHRCVAHDRRGHGRSSQPWDGNEMDTYADDLAELIEALDLRDLTLVGFSTGGGEVARYVGRHGTGRLAGVVLVSAVPPLMLQGPDNPGGVPLEVFDGIRAASLADRSQAYRDLADGPFFGNNRPGADVSQGIRDAFWVQGLQAGHRNAYECIAAFSATDFRGDLAKIDVPALVIHGDDDQVVPFSVGGQASAALIDGASLKVYPGAPHGITDTHKDQLGADLLAFLDSLGERTPDEPRRIHA